MSKNITFTARFWEGFKSNLKEIKKLSCFLFLAWSAQDNYKETKLQCFVNTLCSPKKLSGLQLGWSHLLPQSTHTRKLARNFQ